MDTISNMGQEGDSGLNSNRLHSEMVVLNERMSNLLAELPAEYSLDLPCGILQEDGSINILDGMNILGVGLAWSRGELAGII